uniref:Macrophage-expressed gene 1 protein n=1 Tax=Myripristis murdjan TaxID=586833 RepID=A0A667X8V1_9TELE
MAQKAATLLVLSLLHVCSPHPHSRPSNWLRQCHASTNLSITALEVLPGGGWDNLRNMDMGRVMNFSYSQCQTTEDGLYFIPDEVFVIPQKETGVETNSEIISSWLEQKSSTSHTINSDVSFHEFTMVRNLIYTVKAYPDFTVDSRFAQQAEEIADAIENNQTRLATYLSEKIVFDYGTHVITSVDAGASLVEEDYLRSSYVSDSASQSSTITASAGLNFFDKLKFDISSKDSHQSSSLQAYQSNITYSLVQSHGGIAFYPGITLQKWQESIRNNLVAIDRSGLPLHYFINTNTFPDLPEPTVGKVALSVSHAIESYYRVNTRPGCVDINSKNFNFQANIDDASCDGPLTNLSFGGVYQTCSKISKDADPLCEALAQKNPDTGDFSCRQPYLPTLLRSEERQQGYSLYECHDKSYHCGFLGLFRCHSRECEKNYYVRTAHVDTYWCSVNGKAPDNSGYLFGGLYSPSRVNPLTNAKSCPQNFIPVKFLSDGQVICVSNDYEAGTRFSVPFGGLFSCQSSNPLAEGQRRCPPQFSQHLATISDGCEILYCVKSGLFTGGQLQPVHLPPFSQPPLFTVQATNTVMVMTEGQRNWIRVGQTKMWKLARPDEIKETIRRLNADSHQMSSGAKAGVALGVIGLVVLVVVGALFLVKRRRIGLSSGFRMNRGYEAISGEMESNRAEMETQEQASEQTA